ncbi:MAG TPA: DNA polymerase III subunit beta, partial [Dissulfurispiraceae bacterium]|nr:DNA polymerase III subunit beta [Dissulfurispiraceae bacterium]
EMIDRTLYSAGESDTRYVLNGLHLNLNTEGLLTVVGTDGHRLALAERTLETKVKEERKMILSRKSVAELRRFLDSSGPDVKFFIGKNHVLFQIGEVHFLTRLIEGTYPNYRQVLPLENDKVVTVGRNDLTRALRRVSIMSKERSSAVKIEIGPQEMVISASNPDLGEASDEVPVTYGGDALSTAFNARYILDALDVMDSDRVVIKLKEALSAALVLEEGREDYKCVVMPMRL